MLTWNVARADGEWFRADSREHLPVTYRGKTAIVTAVQLNELKRTGQRRNALGEMVPDDDTVNPYFDLVVQFEDGTLAMTTTYPRSLAVSQEVELSATHGLLATQMSKELPLLVGKAVYAVGYSKLYRTDATLDEVAGEAGTAAVFKQLSLSEVPLLEPLRITAAKYIDSANGVVLKLKFPDGREALSFTGHYNLQETPGAPPMTFFEKIAGFLLTQIPSGLSQQDIEAVKHHSIYRGMKKDAVHYLFGFPDRTNDWGTGGEQLIYGESFLVYLDRQGAVVDWQSLNRN
jgi:hypothetical protein